LSASEDHDLGRGLNVLVVDDDVHALELLQKSMAEAGFAVTVSDIAENLDARIAMLGPDLVLIDVLMPGLSTETLVSLLKLHPGEEPRIVLLTPFPPTFLRTLFDTSCALGVIPTDKRSPEAITADLVSLANTQRARSRQQPSLPVFSGTHRVSGPGASVATDPREQSRAGGSRKR
jgi:DNA-binding NarL/FixJ family response regulator